MPTEAPGWAPPLLAIQFLTRLPVPLLNRLHPDQIPDGLGRMIAWLPLVGTIVGGMTAMVYATALLAWPPAIAAGVALVFEALLTGAFHEDAVADFCDAFGGSASGTEARRIMRDSRIGSYGTLALVLLVGLRWATIAALPMPVAIPAIIAAATFGRFLATGLLALAPPLGDDGIGAKVGAPTGRTMLSAALLTLPGVAPVVLIRPVAAVGIAVAATILLGWLARIVRRRIGGSIGDCLGFAAYLGQLVVLLGLLAA